MVLSAYLYSTKASSKCNLHSKVPTLLPAVANQKMLENLDATCCRNVCHSSKYHVLNMAPLTCSRAFPSELKVLLDCIAEHLLNLSGGIQLIHLKYFIRDVHALVIQSTLIKSKVCKIENKNLQASWNDDDQLCIPKDTELILVVVWQKFYPYCRGWVISVKHVEFYNPKWMDGVMKNA